MLEDPDYQWTIGTRIGRWAGLGPYYAMFPVTFARKAIECFSKPGETVIDPFCGRGTSNYVAQVLGRNSFGCEINPVGWIYAKVKTSPARQISKLQKRVDEISAMRLDEDFLPENEFQEWAWCGEVLAFIKSARRNLDWKGSKTDRTLAAFLLVYLHAKVGGGLSNQMRQSKSLSPDYSVRWWKSRSMRPPQVNPSEYLKSRINWRYSRGFQSSVVKTKIYLGDARKGLGYYRQEPASLILTSPPYLGVTNYQYDNWIRLWALGGPNFPDWGQAHRHNSRVRYTDLLNDVFSMVKNRSRDDACVIVRTDKRRFTLEKTAYAIYENWPNHNLFGKLSSSSKPTQTALFGDKAEKPGEVDLIALPRNQSAPNGFTNIKDF
jgi:hypothetical protein